MLDRLVIPWLQAGVQDDAIIDDLRDVGFDEPDIQRLKRALPAIREELGV